MMMTPQQREKPNLTLYGIETQLLELMNLRDDVFYDENMTPVEAQSSLDAIDKQIAEYISAEVKKADGIAAYLREFEKRAEALKEEADRCYELSKAWQKRHDNLEAMVIDCMQSIKKDRIDGRRSVLALKKNPPSAVIAQPELVPAELQRHTLTLPQNMVEFITTLFEKEYPVLFEHWKRLCSKGPESMKAEILKKLKEKEAVPGCRLSTDKVRLEVR